MANTTVRSHGKNGRMFVQVGSTAVSGPTSLTGNAATEVVDGMTYDAYQVWTCATAPLDPATPPTVTVGGSGLPAAYTYVFLPLLGKLIFTPSLGASATVSISSYATPKLYALGDSTKWSLQTTQEKADATAQMENWSRRTVGVHSANGSAEVYYRYYQATGHSLMLGSSMNSQEQPIVLKLQPHFRYTEYFLCAALIDWGMDADKGGMLMQKVSWECDGSVVKKDS